jgi:hypothetical protein
MNERIKTIKGLISGQVDMGTFGLVELELIALEQEFTQAYSQTPVSVSVCPNLDTCLNKGKNKYCSLEVFKSIDCFIGQNVH